MKILAWLLPFALYLGGGAIARDIYLSAHPISDTTDFMALAKMEYFIYDLIALIYNFIAVSNMRQSKVGEFLAACTWSPAVVFILVAFILPWSNGAMWLNTIVCILSMIITGNACADDNN